MSLSDHLHSPEGGTEKLCCVLKTTRSWTEALNAAAALSTCSCGLGDFFFLNCASSLLCWRLNSKMFPALSHQLHTSPLCILPAALREGGEGVRGGCDAGCVCTYVLDFMLFKVSELMSCCLKIFLVFVGHAELQVMSFTAHISKPCE